MVCQPFTKKCPLNQAFKSIFNVPVRQEKKGSQVASPEVPLDRYDVPGIPWRSFYLADGIVEPFNDEKTGPVGSDPAG